MSDFLPFMGRISIQKMKQMTRTRRPEISTKVDGSGTRNVATNDAKWVSSGFDLRNANTSVSMSYNRLAPIVGVNTFQNPNAVAFDESSADDFEMELARAKPEEKEACLARVTHR